MALVMGVMGVKAQDSLFTYSKIITVDSVSKNDLFDRSLIWCSKAFNDSKDAINVKEREGGIISGKARYYTTYKYLLKKDSLPGSDTYVFDWLIQVKDGKVKFSVSQVKQYFMSMENEYLIVTNSKVSPYKNGLMSRARIDAMWNSSKEQFIKDLDGLMGDLETELHKSTDF
jgi:hypothetical protein